ncbi:DUF1364 domain-containing protein [Pseudomonas inefficax]|uniref:DUF1364 domain-containing protein n=1 Tax=Pseudomonas inefficax TaxID=2078786 RepID=UPI00207BA62D|nr:DUF1364 domain-containing protein [Pseudomonas inefficax]MCM8910885.1 DUF1364 domain-containing protein [Pseudomonas inefficax]
MRQTKLTKAARGQECQVRIPGLCNGNPETTVLAHYRMAGTCGVGYKPNDLQGAWACSACHDACDGRRSDIGRDQARQYHAEGVMRTQALLLREGLVSA